MDPVNRWFPLLIKYLGLVSRRVNGLGGNSGTVPPTLGGVPPSSGRGGKGGCGCNCYCIDKYVEEHHHCEQYEGKYRGPKQEEVCRKWVHGQNHMHAE
jgi:hypothetical protein